jgi:hypothetical protein
MNVQHIIYITERQTVGSIETGSEFLADARILWITPAFAAKLRAIVGYAHPEAS